MSGRSALPLFQVDAFTREPLAGNPAAVCLLEAPRPEAWMQKVAAEMNLSETAFLVPRTDGYDLRWFTPTHEVPLCGHATLASAHTLWESGRAGGPAAIRFHTLSGILVARRAGTRIELDLPAYPPREAPLPEAAREALGLTTPERTPRFTGRTADRGLGDMDYLVELGSEKEVRALRPDFQRLGRDVKAGVIVTARSAAGPIDFVSRYFAPAYGIDEDPVTGVAHCCLVPYWTPRLGKSELVGFQASARGGTVHGRLQEDRVFLSGEAVTVVRGELTA